MRSIKKLEDKTNSYSLPDQQSFLPNFCSNPVIFAIVLIAQLLALVLVLASFPETQDFWTKLALNSVFIQWVALSTAAVLCGLGSLIAQLNTLAATAVAYSLAQLITLTCSLAAFWIMKIPMTGESFQTLLANLTISSIVTLGALRYFYVQQHWKHNIQAEAQTRLKILQTRIRPHFLFNSLNTIASLIRSRPEQAEQAVIDLADVFRSSLEAKDVISLEEELDITRHYLHLESLRLGDRLQVVLQLPDSLPLTVRIPALILQPLVENAVYHGIEPRTDGGQITITIKEQHGMLQFKIVNPLPTSGHVRRSSGHHIAQDNVRQRLALAYGEASRMQIYQQNDQYQVSFNIPCEPVT